MTEKQEYIIYKMWYEWFLRHPMADGDFPNKQCEKTFKSLANYYPLVKKHKITLHKIKSYLNKNRYIGCYGDYKINEDIFYSDFQVIFKMFKGGNNEK